MAQSQELENPFKEFPPETNQAVDGLIYLGHLEDEFVFCGHSFVIRTLKTKEELISGILSKEYSGVLGENRAFMAAQVAMCLVSVDNEPNFCPTIGPDPIVVGRGRFNYITQNWYTPVIEYIFGRYAALLQAQVLAIEAIENLSMRGRPTSTPSADSLTEPDISPDPN